jgi:hypothetical protein
VVVSVGTIEVIAGIAMLITLYIVPFIVARRVRHGEARFGKDGKLMDNE